MSQLNPLKSLSFSWDPAQKVKCKPCTRHFKFTPNLEYNGLGVHRIQNPAGFGQIIRHILESGRMPDLRANPAGFAGFQIWLFFSFNTYFKAATKGVLQLGGANKNPKCIM